MFKTNQLKETMTDTEIKKEILNKIKKAKSAWVFNGFTEFYFKTGKSDILNVFRKSLKNLEGVYKTSFLNEFNDNVRLNDEFELFFN